MITLYSTFVFHKITRRISHTYFPKQIEHQSKITDLGSLHCEKIPHDLLGSRIFTLLTINHTW